LIVLRGAAVPDGRSQLGETGLMLRRTEKLDGGAQVGRRTLVQKHGRIGRKSISPVRLLQKAEHDEIIGQNANAALGRAASLGQRDGRIVPGADGREQLQLDRGLQRRRALEGVERFKDQLRRRRMLSLIGHGRQFRFFKGAKESMSRPSVRRARFNRMPAELSSRQIQPSTSASGTKRLFSCCERAAAWTMAVTSRISRCGIGSSPVSSIWRKVRAMLNIS